jgi:MraZ protein
MFIGEYNNKIDDKGRLAVPAKFRAALAEGAIVTRGLDGCLFVYTKAEWEKLAERLTTLPLTAANARAFARHMLAGAMDVETDKQGRINVPSYLRQFAQIKTNVVVAGLFNRLEIWDEAAWRTYQAKTEQESAEIAEQLMF